MATTYTGTSGRRMAFWSTLGAALFAIVSSAAADSYIIMTSPPFGVGTGKDVRCSIATAGNAKQLGAYVGIRKNAPSVAVQDGAFKIIPGGFVSEQQVTIVSGYQTLRPYTGFLTMSARNNGTAPDIYSCWFWVYTLDGSSVSASDVRAQAEISSADLQSSTVIPVQ